MIWDSSLYYPFHIAWWCEWFQASPNPKINSLPCADGTGMECRSFTSFLKAFASLVALMTSYDYTCFAALDQCWIQALKLPTKLHVKTSPCWSGNCWPVQRWGSTFALISPDLIFGTNTEITWCGAGYEMEWAKAQIPHLVFLKRLVHEQVWQII